jgi:ABC-2 type transport system ATP-binding protein
MVDVSATISPEAPETFPGPARPAIEIRGLRKVYGDLEAVKGIDLEVPAGEIFGFLGPNGAGKSTTIKILCTLVRPTSGDALVAGYNVVEERTEVRRHIGLVFQEPTLDEYLTAEQNLRFHAEIYGIPRAAVASRLDSVLNMVGLADRRKDKVATFSGGLKRRLEIGRGLLHSPRAPSASTRSPGSPCGSTSTSCGSRRASPYSSPPTTWTRRSAATGLR